MRCPVKKHAFIFFLAIGLFLFSHGESVACDFCLLSQGISPLDTIKGIGIKVSERYSLLDRVYQGTIEQTNPGAREDHWTTELTGFYSMTPEFMVLAVVPYRNGSTRGELMTNPDGTMGLDTGGEGKAKGLGDIALMGRYTFLKQENPETTNVMAGLAGIKFSTGKTDAQTADGAEYLDSHLQPGTGSTDYLVGLSFSHSLDRFSVSANVLGTITTEGKFGNTRHTFGDALNYDVSGKYRISPEAFSPQKPQFFLAIGINGEARQREKIDGDTVEDSGGNTVYLTPGIQLVLVPHWAIELSYQHAIYHNLYGTQLGETYKAITGVTYLF
jgi:hypothetical protein